MKHTKRHERRLLDYLDGELGRVEATQVTDHLAVCEPCREKISLFQGDLQHIQAVFKSPPGNGIAPSIEQIQNRAYRLKARKTSVRLGTVGATCAIAVVALWSFSRPAPHALRTTPAVNETQFAEIDAEIDALKIEVARLQQNVKMSAPSPTYFHDEEIAAILVQAGKNLDKEFGLKDEARKRYRLAADTYGSSIAGAEAKILLSKMETK